MNVKIIIYILTILINISRANDRYFGLDEFDDLELKPLEYPTKNIQNKSQDRQKLILFDDNLYLLEDDFDFGTDEIELQKINLDPKDMETAREYENFLNVFFENSPSAGYSLNSINPYNNNPKSSQSKSRSFTRSNRENSSISDRKYSSQPKPPSKGKLGLKVSTILGTSIPMGSNLNNNYTPGSNFGFNIETPISYNIANREARFGIDFYRSSLSAAQPYNLININPTVSLFLSKSIEIKAGVGITPSSIGDYSKVLFSIPVDINYYLPFNFNGFGIALNLHAQQTLGIPNDLGTEDTGGTSEFINLGFFITTPLVF